MEALEFSVPCTNDLKTLKEIFTLKKLGNNRIREIYLAGPEKYSGAGRIMSYEMNINKFTEIVDMIHKAGIRVNLVLNSTCEGSDWYSPEVLKSTLKYIRQVHEEHGVEAVTIANPLYIKEVRRQFPDIEICASVLGDIDCVQRAVIYRDAGADVITPDVNINRNLELLKEIKEATNAELKLMLNEGCLYKCPFRRFHFNYISHRSKEPSKIKGEAAFFFGCLRIYERDHSQILKSCWIRPEDTRKYSEITNYFKIVGRASPWNIGIQIIKCTKAYLRESWNGNLIEIMDASLNKFGRDNFVYLDNKALRRYRFFEKLTSCDYSCRQCSYCDELARKLIRLKVVTQTKNVPHPIP